MKTLDYPDVSYAAVNREGSPSKRQPAAKSHGLSSSMRVALLLLAVAALGATALASRQLKQNQHRSHGGEFGESSTNGSISVAKLNFDYVSTPFIISVFILALVVIKLLYHKVHILAENIPESCMLIIMGLIIGALFTLDKNPNDEKYISFLIFTKESFFLYLLPPIMLEASYSLRDRAFVENLGTILLFAVMGTILNTALISLALWALTFTGIYTMPLSVLQILLFGSLIAAVDPVAVLAIFEEVGVNKMLYFMVFGESLLNDAVTVVLYNLMGELIVAEEYHPIGVKEIGLGFASFFCVSLGACCIGFIWGFICAFVTKFTSEIRVIEPTVMFATAYMAYLCAELVEWSGIIALICCGIIQAQYAFENLSTKSLVTVQYAIKVMAMVMESLIFIILGVMLVNHCMPDGQLFWEYWDTGFSLFALVFCFVFRYIVVFFLTGIVNWYTTGTRHVTFQEQLIMGYGGLRGAVSFSLAFAIDETVANKGQDFNKIRGIFLCATYTVILFTVFVQGTTMKPLVKLLKIQLAKTGPDLGGFRLFNEFHRGIVQNTLAGIEEIIGQRGEHYWTNMAKWFSQKFIRPTFQNKNAHSGAGRGILVTHEQLKFQNGLHTVATESKLDALDKSDMPTHYAAKMLDDEPQEASPAAGKKNKVGLDTARDIAQLRNIIDNPLYRRIHYRDRDELAQTEEQLQSGLKHRKKVRNAFSSIVGHLDSKEVREQAPALSAMMRNMMPMARLAVNARERTASSASHRSSTDAAAGDGAAASGTTADRLESVDETRPSPDEPDSENDGIVLDDTNMTDKL